MEIPTFLTKLIEHGYGYIAFVLLAVLGGTVNYLRRINKGIAQWSLPGLLFEWTLSGFTGLLTAYLCVGLGMSWEYVAFCTAISGNVSGRLLDVYGDLIISRIQSLIKGIK